MSGPDDIKAKAQSLWDSGRLLRAWLGAEELFPWSLLLAPPQDGGSRTGFVALREWKEGIEAGCKCAGGEGYRIEYREIGHHRLGRRRLPERVVFDAPLDLVGYLGKGPELADFVRLGRAIHGRFPVLRAWIDEAPMQVLEHAEEWPRLLEVLDWFVAHPRTDIDIRELVIPGVDSDFMEGHKHLLADLLDRVLPGAAWNR